MVNHSRPTTEDGVTLLQRIGHGVFSTCAAQTNVALQYISLYHLHVTVNTSVWVILPKGNALNTSSEETSNSNYNGTRIIFRLYPLTLWSLQQPQLQFLATV